jgi:sigma-B regulation protein RsbU (phosphoserine phosphatase)
MHESDSTAAKPARISEVEVVTMPGVSDPYIREQLEKRREELTSAISSVAPATPAAPFLDALSEVNSALQRMEEGTYGICPTCNDTVEKERLLSDPLVRFCLDHLTSGEQRALERDMELAARIQRGLLPEPQVRSGDWNIHYQYKPAGLVSGDYCDLILPTNGQGKLVFLFGDVAGKGVAASLLMTHLHAMFRSLAGVGLELEGLLERANHVFCESTIAGQYATLICGRAGASGEIEIGSAGHFPALLIEKNGVRKISSTGLPLGMFAKSQYTIDRLHLGPGDSLVLYTDGISEAANSNGEEYGVARIMRVAGERHGWKPQELLAACLKDVNSFSSGTRQADDQMMMVIHRADAAGLSLND